MQEFEFGIERAVFLSVGMLRDTLKKYPDNTPITMNGVPGEVIEDERKNSLSLVALECDNDESTMYAQEAATMGQEYMEF